MRNPATRSRHGGQSVAVLSALMLLLSLGVGAYNVSPATARTGDTATPPQLTEQEGGAIRFDEGEVVPAVVPEPVFQQIMEEVAANTVVVAVAPFAFHVQGWQSLASGLEQQVANSLQRHPRIRVVSAAEVLRRALDEPLFNERRELAARHLEEGIRQYKQMRLVDALDHLEKAQDLMDQVNGALLLGAEAAQVHLYSGLAALERGMYPQAHLSFKRLLSIKPWFRFEEGHFSSRAISAFDVALNDFLAGGREMSSPGSLARLASSAGADYLVLGEVNARVEGGVSVAMHLFEPGTRRMIEEERVPISERSLEANSERMCRVVSRMAACIPDHEALRGASRAVSAPAQWNAEFGPASLVFLDSFTRSPLPNYGFRMAVSRRNPRRPLYWWGGAMLLASGEDQPRRDIQDKMTSVRLVGGAGYLVVSRRVVEVAVLPSLDVAVLPWRAAYSYDASCKYDPASNPDCAGKIEYHDPLLLVGANLATDVSFRVGSRLRVYLHTGIGRYLWSFDDNRLDLPVDAVVGGRYRF